MLRPLLGETRPVRDGVASPEQLVDWLTRLMISAVLFPDPNPDRMAHDLTAVYRLLTEPLPSRRRPVAGRRPAPQRDGKD